MGNTPLIFVRYFWGGRLTSHNFLVLGDDLVVLTVSRKIYMVTIVSTEWFATSISISPTTNNPPKSNITTEHKRHPQKKKKLVLQSITIYLWQTLRLRQIQYLVWEVPKNIVETDWLDVETSKTTLEILAFSKERLERKKPFEKKKPDGKGRGHNIFPNIFVYVSLLFLDCKVIPALLSPKKFITFIFLIRILHMNKTILIHQSPMETPSSTNAKNNYDANKKLWPNWSVTLYS